MRSEPFPNDVVIRIVDDDDAVRRALTRLVESMGMHAESFATPEQLLTREPDHRVRCLLLDVKLPGMDGFELHRRIVEGGQAAPVIFITAHPHETARARARQADAVALLEKPFDDETLLEALEAALDRSIAAGGPPPPPEEPRTD
jgi:FixJ family two-component response regulator